MKRDGAHLHAPGLHDNNANRSQQAENRCERLHSSLRGKELELFASPFLDVHVFEFAGFEDFAALFALDKLGVGVAAYDLHTRVLAGLRGACAWTCRGRSNCHKPGSAFSTSQRSRRIRGNFSLL